MTQLSAKSQPNSLRNLLRLMPKIDLHRHMEGSLRLSTLVEIAHDHGSDLDPYDIDALRPLVQMVDEEPNFQTFLAKFAILRRFYTSKESVMRIAYESVADCALDNVKYLELRFNPVAQASQQGFDFEDVADWVIQATQKAQQYFDINVKLIIQIGRHEPQHARQLAELAVARKDQGVVALDLAGDEEHFSSAKFVEPLRWAKEHGLFITAHAGECRHCPAENIIEAVNVIQADRIGHGVQGIHRSDVIQLLRDKNITLEMCPTSNIQTAAIERMSRHPLQLYHQLGVPVTINTDDPSVSNITLTDEYLVAMQSIGISFDDLKTMVLNAARASFLPTNKRAALIAQFENELNLLSYP